MTDADPASTRTGTVRWWETGAGHGFRALRHLDYRILFLGNVASAAGFWLAHVTLQGQVNDLSGGSTFQQSLLFNALFLPALIVAPIAGVIADRVDRRLMLRVCYAGVAVCAGLLALLDALGNERTATILALALPLGLFQSASAPAQAAAVANTVPTSDLASAISIQAAVMNLSRVAGPLVAAPLIAAERYAAGIAALAVGAALSATSTFWLRLQGQRRDTEQVGFLSRVADGFRHARDRPPALGVLAIMASLSVFGIAHTVLLPNFTEEVLDQPAGRFGWIVAAVGLGAVAGALANGYDQRPAVLRRAAAYFFAYSLAYLGVALSPVFAVALAFEIVVGVFYFLCVTQLQTIIQQVVDDEKRGRVMSLFQICWAGVVPLGALLLGSTAEGIGTRATMVAAACVCLAVSGYATAVHPRRPAASAAAGT